MNKHLIIQAAAGAFVGYKTAASGRSLETAFRALLSLIPSAAVAASRGQLAAGLGLFMMGGLVAGYATSRAKDEARMTQRLAERRSYAYGLLFDKTAEGKAMAAMPNTNTRWKDHQDAVARYSASVPLTPAQEAWVANVNAIRTPLPE